MLKQVLLVQLGGLLEAMAALAKHHLSSAVQRLMKVGAWVFSSEMMSCMLDELHMF